MARGLIFLLLLASCIVKANGIDTTRILFVGNSLTYTNDLPSLVTDKAAKKNVIVQTEMLALPNYALTDHWNEGKLQDMLEIKHYDFVVVQQGPSSQEEGRVMLLDAGKKLENVCSNQNSKLVFFMVWPAYPNFYNFDNVIKNYTNAAIAANAILCPVGTAWKKYIDETGDLSYYGPDQFHPSLKGSKVAAEIIVKTLFP